jgi:hypothetical protein
MALANLACLLARPDATRRQSKPPRVLAIDWDFQAPGLHRYFEPYLEPTQRSNFRRHKVAWSFFRLLAATPTSLRTSSATDSGQEVGSTGWDLKPYLLATRFPGLSLIKAGLFDEDYPRRVSEFNWDHLFHATVGLFAGFADFLRSQFEYVLIDSRTGVSDVSGICTMLLPDKLVVVFTLNQQSLAGIAAFEGQSRWTLGLSLSHQRRRARWQCHVVERELAVFKSAERSPLRSEG